MASISWENKYKTATEAKAHFRHNERECRENTKEHNNQHIDRSRTYLNYSIKNRSYAERCKIYDDTIADIQSKRKKALRKDAVTCLGLEVSIPPELPESRAIEWFSAYHNILCGFFGDENVIDTDVHFDEIHEYIDSATHKKTLSRIHAHTNIIPRTSDGRLCCKEISSRANIIELNRRVEEMTQDEFGVQFNTGETARKKSVEQLKAESLQLENALASEELERNRQQIDVLADTMKFAPKQKRRNFKEVIKEVIKGVPPKEQYVMDKQAYDDYIQFADEMKRNVHNAVDSDENRQATAETLAEAERLKEQQKQLVKQQAEQLARQIANQAVMQANKREKEAEQAKQEAEQMKQQYEKLKNNETAYIMQNAKRIAEKTSATFRSLDSKRKFEMLKQTADSVAPVTQPERDYTLER